MVPNSVKPCVMAALRAQERMSADLGPEPRQSFRYGRRGTDGSCQKMDSQFAHLRGYSESGVACDGPDEELLSRRETGHGQSHDLLDPCGDRAAYGVVVVE